MIGIGIPYFISGGMSAAFTPADVSLFYAEAEKETAYIDNDPVSTITNQVGGGLNGVQSGTSRPLYKTGIFNASRASYRFDGVDDWIDLQDTYNAAMLNQAQWGVVFVMQLLTNDGSEQPLFGATAGTTSEINLDIDVDYGIFIKDEDNAQEGIGGGTPDLNEHIVIYHVNFTDDVMQIEVDGVQIASPGVIGDFVPNFGLATSLALCRIPNSVNYANVDVGAVNFGAMNITEAQKCRDFYNENYSIY